MTHNSTEAPNYFSSPALLEEVYELLKALKAEENCEFCVEIKTDSKYYDYRNTPPAWCYIYPVFNHTQSRVALNDYPSHMSLAFFSDKSQPLIRRLNDIFSIAEQRINKTVYSKVVSDVIISLFSFKQSIPGPKPKYKISNFDSDIIKSFKKAQREDSFFIVVQRYLLSKNLEKTVPQHTALETHTKTFKI